MHDTGIYTRLAFLHFNNIIKINYGIFFSGIRRRIKKLIPKEVRPAIPFLAAAVPGMAGLGPIASPFTKAALARIASDDEADIKDALRAGAIAAAPACD